MSLFDKLGITDKEKLNKEESFAGIILSAIAADGRISEEECRGIITSILRMKQFQNYNQRQMQKIFDKLVNIIRDQGVEKLILLTKDNLSPDLRETAFAVAVDLALADGYLNKEEKDILTKIQQNLDIPEDTALKIIDVMLIKNKD